MVNVKAIWQCMFAPKLIKIYGNSPDGGSYQPSSVEGLGDRVLKSMFIMWKIGLYTSPLIIGFLYRRGYFESEGFVTLTKFVSLIGGIIVVSYVIRGIGRANNANYAKFVKVLDESNNNMTPYNKRELLKYDFDFASWPVEIKYKDLTRDETKTRLYINKTKFSSNFLQVGITLPCHVLAYIAVHTFGIRLVYPGSIGVLQSILASSLLQGRTKLIEKDNGVRYKLQTKDGNAVDTMFVDKRNSSENGNTLVICCEGNAGFYEIGIMATPIAAGYSTLGWNHPGFGGSTGTPYPSQELNAMDTVMQFAIKRLGFRIENIVIFGWSIGGFSASWAAMNYPDVKALILDASFDDIMPLALGQMPSWTESIVKIAIRDYINLHNFEQISQYPGPILLVRRTQDEVICTTMGDISTNRGNNLLIKLLKYRYPHIMGETQQQVLKTYLGLPTTSAQEHYLGNSEKNNSFCSSFIENYFNDNLKTYPSRLGDDLDDEKKSIIALYLARMIMKDYKAPHCSPLPSDMFHMPWDVNAGDGKVLDLKTNVTEIKKNLFHKL